MATKNTKIAKEEMESLLLLSFLCALSCSVSDDSGAATPAMKIAAIVVEATSYAFVAKEYSKLTAVREKTSKNKEKRLKCYPQSSEVKAAIRRKS